MTSRRKGRPEPFLLVAAAAVLAGVFWQVASTSATEIPVPAGDANCSRTVNSLDASLILQLSAGLLHSLPCRDDADANEDGRVDSLDATLVLQYDAGLLATLPPPLFTDRQCRDLVEPTVTLVTTIVLGPPLAPEAHALVKGAIGFGVFMCLNSPLMECGKALDKWDIVADEGSLAAWVVDVANACS